MKRVMNGNTLHKVIEKCPHCGLVHDAAGTECKCKQVKQDNQ